MWLALAIVGGLALTYFGVRLGRWLLTPLIASFRDKPAQSYEHYYFVPKESKPGKKKGGGQSDFDREKFPSLFDKASVTLSVIAPAKDEQERLPAMMDEAVDWLEENTKKNKNFTYEIIVVDDGSKDNTVEVALRYTKKYGASKVRVLSLPQNQGKGGAVQQGMLNARGRVLLMADSDGATKFADVQKLMNSIAESSENDQPAVAVGSRAHLADKAVVERKWYRTVLMWGFHIYVSVLCVRDVKDTQCGFKLFTRKAARVLFSTQRLRRWSFDVELLFIAQQLKMPIKEVAVNWQEIPGSKLNLVDATLMMLRDLLVIRFAYATGLGRKSNTETMLATKTE